MLRKPPQKAYILCLLVLTNSLARAQDRLLLKKHLADVLIEYQRQRLPDTAYLNAVDSSIGSLLDDDSLVSLMSTYRQIAFNNKGMGRSRKKYYAIMAMYSFNKNKYGSAIYYSEKNNEEAVKAGIFEKGGIPHSDQFAIGVYNQNRDYARVLSKYRTLRPLYLSIPGSIALGEISAEQANVAFTTMNDVVDAAYKTGDTILANEGIGTAEKMLSATLMQAGKYKGYTTLYSCAGHLMAYFREKYRGNTRVAGDFLQSAMHEMASRDFPEDMRPGYAYDLYAEAFDFYLDAGRQDSAQHYLALVHDLPDDQIKFTGIKQHFLLESNSKLEARNGNFGAAYQDLRKLYGMRDSAFYAVSSDKDNNLYALAEAENTRNDLLSEEAKREHAEKSNHILFGLLALLCFGGAIGFLLYRAREKQRLLNLQLSLARNFHDEIGPMLLYANTLVKKEMATNGSPRLDELKGHLAHIMDAVRGISHDLKSSELMTVSSLYRDISTLLEKIRASTRIDFTISINQGSRILSYWQYNNLRKIVNELITNSIKHADCTLIRIGLNTTERELCLTYSDNGKGIAEVGESGKSGDGIGLQNIKERTAMLNGRFELNNAWPEGYTIDISIPLL